MGILEGNDFQRGLRMVLPPKKISLTAKQTVDGIPIIFHQHKDPVVVINTEKRDLT